jgi:hypothetical protein
MGVNSGHWKVFDVALCTGHSVLALAIAGRAFALNRDTRTPSAQATGISLGIHVTTDGTPRQGSARSTCRRVNDVTACEGRTDTDCDGVVTASEVPRLGLDASEKCDEELCARSAPGGNRTLSSGKEMR